MICDWTDRNKYWTQYGKLKVFVEMGMKVKKRNKVMKFKQKEWLKPYIDLNTQSRSPAENEFQETFCKRMNNNFSGKFVEDVRKRKKW